MGPSRRQPGRLPSDAVIARGAVAVLVAFVVVGGALFLLSFLGDGSSGTRAAPSSTPSPLPTRALSPSPSASESATPSPSATRTTPAAEARRMATFVRTYLATVTRDPAGGWTRLTPDFQARSGGFGAYQRFWGSIRTATTSGVRADPATMTVEYDVAYTRRDGSRSTDHPRLLLRRDGDRLLIAGEA